MDSNIKCIFFDLGGTLRMTHRVESHEKAAKKTITDENRPDYIVHAFSDILNLEIFN